VNANEIIDRAREFGHDFDRGSVSSLLSNSKRRPHLDSTKSGASGRAPDRLMNHNEYPKRLGISRLFGGYLTDVAAHNFRRIVEVVGFNDVAALFLFGLAVIAVIWLKAIEGDRLLGIVILFAILLFYYRLSGTKVRLAELKNEAVRLH
jgi:hypothetical protein